VRDGTKHPAIFDDRPNDESSSPRRDVPGDILSVRPDQRTGDDAVEDMESILS
jgi:hypothetical protein